MTGLDMVGGGGRFGRGRGEVRFVYVYVYVYVFMLPVCLGSSRVVGRWCACRAWTPGRGTPISYLEGFCRSATNSGECRIVLISIVLLREAAVPRSNAQQ